MKIIIYAIAKNEELHAARFMSTARLADGVCIVDTGSTDKTKQIFLDNGAQIEDLQGEFRFDTGRNQAMAMACRLFADADVLLSLDIDELLPADWREHFEKAFTGNTLGSQASRLPVKCRREACDPSDASNASAPSRCAYLLQNGPGNFIRRNWAHRPTGYHWECPVHEAMIRDADAGPEIEVFASGLLVQHLPEAGKMRQYNALTLLELAVKERPNDARMAHYLGREYFYHNRRNEAREWLMKHAEWVADREPGRTEAYALERAESLRLLACMEPWAGKVWLLERAVELDKQRRDCLVDLAEALYHLQRWQPALNCCLEAQAITDRASSPYLTYAKAWSGLPSFIASGCCWNLGMRNSARQFARLAIAAEPESAEYAGNLNWMNKF